METNTLKKTCCEIFLLISQESSVTCDEFTPIIVLCPFRKLYTSFTCLWTPLLLWEDHYIFAHHVIVSHVRDKKWYLCMLQCRMVHDNTVNSVKYHNQFLLICLITFRFINPLKGHRHDWGQCLFTKIIWREILIDFSQKVIQNCTNNFGKDWAINRAEITHLSLYL